MTTAPVYRSSTTGLTSGTSHAVACPSGLANNDVVTVAILMYNTSTVSPPDGTWTAQTPQTVGSDKLWVFTHAASGSEPSSWTFTSTSGTFLYLCDARRGADTTNPVAAFATGTASTNPTLGSISPSMANCSLLAIVMLPGSTATVNITPDAAMTERATFITGGFEYAEYADQSLTSSGATGTRSVTGIGARTNVWAMVAIAPAPPPPIVVSPTATSLTTSRGTPTVTRSDNKRVAPTAKTATLTPGTPTVTGGQSVSVSPAAASLTLSPGTATAGHSGRAVPAAASLALSPDTPTVGHSGRAAPDAASMALDPSTPTIRTPRSVAPDAGSLTLTPDTPIVGHSGRATPVAASLTLTPDTPTVGPSRKLSPIAASLITSPGTPHVVAGVTVSPAALSLLLSPGTPHVGPSARMAPSALALVLSPGTAVVGPSARLAPAHLSLVLTRGTPKVGHSGRTAPIAASLTLSPHVPIVGASSILSPTAAALITALGTPSVGASFHLSPAALALVLTPDDASVDVSKSLHPTAPSLTLTTFAPQLFASGPAISSDLVTRALNGQYGPVVITWRIEKRTKTNQFLLDVTDAFLAADVDGNNDRAVFRAATFTIDPNLATINPLSDHVALIADVMVHEPNNGPFLVSIESGLFALNVPTKTFASGQRESWKVQASDLGIHLVEATTTDTYTVAAGENYITGTNAVNDILDAFGLTRAVGNTTLTLPVDQSWPSGTPWLTVINDLLAAINFYSLKFDRMGVARSRQNMDNSQRAADIAYTDGEWLIEDISEQTDTTRFANQVIAVVNDPSRDPLVSVATNDDPDSPISTVTLGRTISKTITSDAADQDTLDAVAAQGLRDAAGAYRTATINTQIDPRRDPFELYSLTDSAAGYSAQLWLARNWKFSIDKPDMQHVVSRVEKVLVST